MSPRERAEHNYEHMKVGDLVKHWDGNIGIVLEIDPIEARIKWMTNKKLKNKWCLLYNLETLSPTTMVGVWAW